MTAEDWAARSLVAIKEDRLAYRAESLWRTFAPNQLDLLIGETIADLGGVRGSLSMTTPDEWLAVAELVSELLDREPLKSSPRWSGQRIILGIFAAELKGYVGSAERHHAD
jgi:hypothetical protein